MSFTKLSFIVKRIFALILVSVIFKHPKYRIRKNYVDMCARDGRGAIEICLSEKGALAKKDWETLPYTFPRQAKPFAHSLKI